MNMILHRCKYDGFGVSFYFGFGLAAVEILGRGVVFLIKFHDSFQDQISLYRFTFSIERR